MKHRPATHIPAGFKNLRLPRVFGSLVSDLSVNARFQAVRLPLCAKC